MHQEPQAHHGSQDLYRTGVSIQASADIIMNIVQQERAHAIRSTAESYQNFHRQYFEGYQKRAREAQISEAEKLVQSQNKVIELTQKCHELQALKKTDEAMLQNLSMQLETLKQQHSFLQSKWISYTQNQKSAYLAGGQAYHSSTVKELTKFGITYCGPDQISLGEPWLQLLDLYMSEDPSNRISSEDRISPKDLDCIIENFANQIRSYKGVVQKLEDHVDSLKSECDRLFQLADGNMKTHGQDPKLEDMQEVIKDESDNKGENSRAVFMQISPSLSRSILYF